jgi:glucan phosphorylase
MSVYTGSGKTTTGETIPRTVFIFAGKAAPRAVAASSAETRNAVSCMVNEWEVGGEFNP